MLLICLFLLMGEILLSLLLFLISNTCDVHHPSANLRVIAGYLLTCYLALSCPSKCMGLVNHL